MLCNVTYTLMGCEYFFFTSVQCTFPKQANYECVLYRLLSFQTTTKKEPLWLILLPNTNLKLALLEIMHDLNVSKRSFLFNGVEPRSMIFAGNKTV